MTFPLTRSRSRARFFGTPFSPVSLFANGEQGAWYDPSDLTTLFQNDAGTTPTTMETRARLMLDKSKGGVGTNGAKRVNRLEWTEAFDNAYWTAGASGLLAFGSGSVANTTATTDPLGGTTADLIVQDTSTGLHRTRSPEISFSSAQTHVASIYIKPAGVRYIEFGIGGSINDPPVIERFLQVDLQTGTITRNATNNSGVCQSVGNGWFRISFVMISPSTTVNNRFSITMCSDAAYTASFTGDGTSGLYLWGADLRFGVEASTLPLYQPITASWVATMAGNHATAPSDASSPILRARYNLLEYSEQFDNAYWTNTNLLITKNVGIAPNNTNTANSIVATTDLATHIVRRDVVLGAASYTLSIYAKQGTGTPLNVGLLFNTTAAGALFNPSNGSVVQTLGTVVTGAQFVGDGWWRFTITAAIAAITENIRVYVGSGTTWTTTWSGDGTSGIFIWGADLRTSSDAALNIPAYQSITTATSYDTNGFPPYLAFDGTDDSFSTASIDFTGTDKMTVFAGVTKLSDAAQGVVAELSAAIASNNGTFLLAAPDGATQTFGWDSKGTLQVDAVATSQAAPRNAVLTGIGDIGADICTIRVNGAQADTDTGDQGSGNYANAAVFIGRTNNTSAPLNGRIYSLIIRGAATTTPLIASTESWVAGKMRLPI